MSPARRAASAASSVGTVSGEELCGLGSSFDAAAVPLSKRCAGEQRGGFLEVVRVSEVTDVEASQFHSSLSPTGQPGRHGRGRVRPHCMQGVPVWLCVRVCVVVCVCGGVWSACSPRPAHPTSIWARSIVIKTHNCPVSKGPVRGVRVCKTHVCHSDCSGVRCEMCAARLAERILPGATLGLSHQPHRLAAGWASEEPGWEPIHGPGPRSPRSLLPSYKEGLPTQLTLLPGKGWGCRRKTGWNGREREHRQGSRRGGPQTAPAAVCVHGTYWRRCAGKKLRAGYETPRLQRHVAIVSPTS